MTGVTPIKTIQVPKEWQRISSEIWDLGRIEVFYNSDNQEYIKTLKMSKLGYRKRVKLGQTTNLKELPNSVAEIVNIIMSDSVLLPSEIPEGRQDLPPSLAQLWAVDYDPYHQAWAKIWMRTPGEKSAEISEHLVKHIPVALCNQITIAIKSTVFDPKAALIGFSALYGGSTQLPQILIDIIDQATNHPRTIETKCEMDDLTRTNFANNPELHGMFRQTRCQQESRVETLRKAIALGLDWRREAQIKEEMAPERAGREKEPVPLSAIVAKMILEETVPHRQQKSKLTLGNHL